VPKEIVKPFVQAPVTTPAIEAAETTPAGGGILSKVVPTVKEMDAPSAEPAVAVSPAVSDPAPVTEEPMETQETDQMVQKKKKGRKPLILTSAQGLGGNPDTYSPTLLG